MSQEDEMMVTDEDLDGYGYEYGVYSDCPENYPADNDFADDD